MNFTKDDLKPGMLCVLRDGKRCIVLPYADGRIGLWYGDNCATADTSMSPDMKDGFGHTRYDVMQVYGFFNGGDAFETNRRSLLWERPVPKKMTISQIEEALGYPIEIIKEEE